ncbi:MAG: hypothetical protein DSY70_03865 [Desulfobulbus sp.]|nr:MAG: hypothetical protein DSY70_03865 [Desulfobulbus sp.]
MPHKKQKYKDKRLLVLIAFGAGLYWLNIFGVDLDFFTTNYDLEVVTVDNGASIVRIRDSKANTQKKSSLFNSVNTVCRDIVPRFSLLLDLPMPINRADEQTLTMLPGVGPHTAQKILSLRNRIGRISNLEELQMVRGIGPGTASRLKPLLCFD